MLNFTILSGLAKFLYAEPRLFWSTDSIEPLKCVPQYGQPSGHAMVGVGYTILVTLDSIAVNSQYRSGQKASFLGGSLLFGLSIAYSRTILGVHSWDQIIYGMISSLQ